MLQESRKTRHFRRHCVHMLDCYVFAKIRFNRKQERDIVYDSYIENLDTLIEYAITNGMNIDQYFKDIKKMLLTSKRVHEHKR